MVVVRLICASSRLNSRHGCFAWQSALRVWTKGVSWRMNLSATESALKKFREIVEEQGGDPGAIDDPRRLPQAQRRAAILSPSAGFVEAIHCEQVGIASLVLGGGRETKDDEIDHAVGLVLHKKVGDPVHKGEALCTIYYNSDARLGSAQSLLQQAYRIADAAPVVRRPLIHRVVRGKGIQA